ncbi:type II toxin-antitoxin system Phd/YefM family antitoxin [Gloeobacter morelensis]|uniref:Antitoxin n=1 Tax=Gloeobacter morelensis MG652769 TaxID=2781736 RepID=A0ABY3PQK9_9CYAN|nr:type II toxin-antitoxin system Phd/YefM family antitoxin [Gloeobacter morelensis]UFP95907.1 type II toxin-antitoxin system Phd/YefM family antitoxin [Gloeobacter morelensis MG652769]
MPDEYSIAEARDHLSSIVRTVESGKPVRLTRRGKPVVVLLSAKDYDQLCHREHHYWDALQTFLEAEKPDIEPEIFAGTRDETVGRPVVL